MNADVLADVFPVIVRRKYVSRRLRFLGGTGTKRITANSEMFTADPDFTKKLTSRR